MAAGTLSTIGFIGSLIMQGVGLGLQSKSQRQAISREEERYQESLGERAKAYSTQQQQLAQNRMSLMENIRNNRRKLKWEEDQANYAKTQNMTNNLINVLNRDPQLKNNLIRVWRS